MSCGKVEVGGARERQRGKRLWPADLTNQVKGFELYPEGKGEPVKGFKGKSGTLCLKFKKMPLAAACRFGRRRDQGGGWNQTPGESRRGLNAGGWARERHLVHGVVNMRGVGHTARAQVCGPWAPALDDSTIL